METALKVIGGIVVILVAMIVAGLVLSVLWGWFIVPLGLPAITIPQALGISLVVGFITWKPKEDKDESFGMKLVGYFATYFFYLAYGFILSGFMPK